jgi:hypothetical protein
MNGPDPWLIAAFPLAFAALWCAILSIIARVGGWSALAGYYRADNRHDGPRRRFQSITIERRRAIPVAVNNVADVGVEGSYLRLSMFAPFCPFHPPLKISFLDLSAHERKSPLGPRVDVVAAREPGIRIVMARSLAKWIAERSGGLFRVEGSA